MVILGIDGSLRCTGWGVIEGTRTAARAKAWGTIPMAATAPHSACLLAIRETLDGLIARERPDALSMEEGFFAKNARTAMILGEVRGVVISCAAAAGIPIFGYSPRDAKQAVTGWGAAGKEQVGKMVMALFGLRERPPEDACDALALAYCHLQSNRLLPPQPL
jgi:crossover junction endodeoxyribonuclease RuvC